MARPGIGRRPSHPISSQSQAEGITGLIDRLEGLGLVTRERSTEDRRVVFVAITPEALDLLGRLDEPVKALHQRLLGHLTEAELADLIRLLEKARRPLSEEAE